MTVEEEIGALKKQHGALILAHNYTRPEIQGIADFVGDSLELSRKAGFRTLGIAFLLGLAPWRPEAASLGAMRSIL